MDFNKVDNLMKELTGKDKILAHQTDLLYQIHNELYPDIKEFCKSCPEARWRVFCRVQDWWNINKTDK